MLPGIIIIVIILFYLGFYTSYSGSLVDRYQRFGRKFCLLLQGIIYIGDAFPAFVVRIPFQSCTDILLFCYLRSCCLRISFKNNILHVSLVGERNLHLSAVKFSCLWFSVTELVIDTENVPTCFI